MTKATKATTAEILVTTHFNCPLCFNDSRTYWEANGANFIEDTKPSNEEES